jgi:hypothetical protein
MPSPRRARMREKEKDKGREIGICQVGLHRVEEDTNNIRGVRR